MKVVHPSEVFDVVQFLPENDPSGMPKYGPHSSGAHVVSGHEGPEAMFKSGDRTVHAKVGDIVMFGDRGGFRILKPADFTSMLKEGALVVVPEASGASTNIETAALVPPKEAHAQEAQVAQSEEIKGGVSDAGVQEGILEERFQEGAEGQVPETGNRDSTLAGGPVEEEKEAGQNKIRRGKGA